MASIDTFEGVAVSAVDLAVLDDPRTDVPTLSDKLATVTGSRPSLQIDITDAGVVITARCGDVVATGLTADDATKALGPAMAAEVRKPPPGPTK